MGDAVTLSIDTDDLVERAKARTEAIKADRSASRVLQAMQSTPWGILPEALEQLQAIAERVNEAPEAVAAKLGRPLDNTRTVVERDGVAIIPIVGPVFRYANLFTRISGATSIEVLATDFVAALDNPAISSIILEIDSPGGMIAGVSEFSEMVRQADKPVVAYISAMGASAAYWMASAANSVVIGDTSMAGSVGAVLSMSTKKDGGTVEIVSSQSPRKRPDVSTEEGRGQVQELIDSLAQVFVETVARNRGVTVETVLANFGQGALFVGAQAVDAGMADAVGSLESIIAGLSGTASRGRTVMAEQADDIITIALVEEKHPAIADHFRTQGRSAIITALEALMADEPAEADAALISLIDGMGQAGAEKERARIQSVEQQLIPGHAALIEGLKYDGKTTGPEAAVAVLQAEKKSRETALSNIQADAPAGVRQITPAATVPSVDPNLPLEDRCKAEWDKSPDVRAEFGDLKAFTAFKRAEESGRVRILRR